MLGTITSSIEEHKDNYKQALIDDLMLETETISPLEVKCIPFVNIFLRCHSKAKGKHDMSFLDLFTRGQLFLSIIHKEFVVLVF